VAVSGRITLDAGAEVPDDLRFDKRRAYKGRTVNISSLVDNPRDAMWLMDLLSGGPAGDGDEAEGEPGREDRAEQVQPEDEPGSGLEIVADDGASIRQAFARMPAPLMRTEEDGARVPDWGKILAGIQGQSRKQLELRCMVAEQRFRDRMTREAIVQEATAGLRGRNASKARAEKYRAIWAAWRWLDRPANQEKIAAVIKQARADRPKPTQPKPTAEAPAPKDAVGVLLMMARRRIRARVEAMKLDYPGPSIMTNRLK
jgi:hypothetical protein